MDDLNPTPCRMWEEKLAALHPDDLSFIERKALKEHIASCTACEAVLADYYRMRNLIRSAFTPDHLPGIWKSFLSMAPEQLVMNTPSIRLVPSRSLMGSQHEEAEKMVAEEAETYCIRLSKVQRQQLSQSTEGLPLPIKLSMARLKNGETFDEVIHWLNNASGNLPDYCIKEQLRLVRLQSSNAWRLLLCFSLFDQGVGASRDALAATTDLSSAELEKGLALLQQHALINQSMDKRYRLLSFIHGYVTAEFLTDETGPII